MWMCNVDAKGQEKDRAASKVWSVALCCIRIGRRLRIYTSRFARALQIYTPEEDEENGECCSGGCIAAAAAGWRGDVRKEEIYSVIV